MTARFREPLAAETRRGRLRAALLPLLLFGLGSPLAALLIWNRMPIDAVIHPGQRLVVLPFHLGKDWETETAGGD